MADVTQTLRSGGGDDRGQLLLVGALALAVLFVSLAFLLNAAIYTETIATRSTDADATGVVAYRAAAVDATARSVTDLSVGHNATYDSMATNLRTGMATWDAAAGRHHATSGDVPSVAVVSIRNGTRIVQNGSRDFTDATGAPDWTVATDAGIRNGTMVVERDGTANVSDESLSALSGDAFRLNVTASGSGNYSVFVYRHAGNLTLRAFAPDGSSVDGDSCSRAGETVRVDVTGGRFGGRTCDDLAFVRTRGGPYDVSVRDGNRVNGTYSLTVSRPVGELDASSYAAFGGPEPFRSTAIYAVELRVVYRGPSTYYRWETEVAPGAVA